MIRHHGCSVNDQVKLKGSARAAAKPVNCIRAPSHPMLRLQAIVGNQATRRLVLAKRSNDALICPELKLQRYPGGREISRQEIEKCIQKWEKQPEKMSIHAADYFLGEIDSSLTARYGDVDCASDNDCTVTVTKDGPVLDVRWVKDTRRVGVGYNHASGRRFCAWDYNGCDQFNRHTPNGVLTLTLVACHGPKP
jgi:hypothetical protein